MADAPDDRFLEENFPAFWDRLLQARDQDRAEFDRLFGLLVDRWSPDLYALAGRTVDDVSRGLHGLSGFCQASWQRVAVALSQFGNGPGRNRSLAEFKEWVRTILRNVIFGAKRHQMRHGPDAGNYAIPADRLADRDGADGPHQVEADDELARLAAVVAALPAEDRELLALWQEAGSYAGVARQIGVSEYLAKEKLKVVFSKMQALWSQP